MDQGNEINNCIKRSLYICRVIRTGQLLILVASLMLSSCFEQGDCQNQTSNIIKVAFFKSADRKSLELQLDSVTVSGLTGKFIEDEQLSAIVIPLNPVADKSIITLYRPEGISTLTIEYLARTTVLDPACGATELFTLKSAEGSGFESAVITQDLVSVSLTTNVSVYF